jgi:hypothetical protein
MILDVSILLFQLDAALGERNELYAQKREKGEFDEVKIFLVKPQTFNGMKQIFNKTYNNTSDQYKTPRTLKLPAAIEHILNSCL